MKKIISLAVVAVLFLCGATVQFAPPPPDGIATHFLNGQYQWTSSTDTSAVWGSISGTLSAQTDLAAALTSKAPATTGAAILKGNNAGGFAAASAGSDYVAPGLLTTSGMTMGTGALIGRTSASFGAVQEITIGPNLDLSSGVLSWTSSITSNVTTVLAVGSTTYIDANFADATNDISGAFTLSYATNGAHRVAATVVRWFFNGSGSDQTLTIPSGWRTNVYSPVPTKFTNGTITKMVGNFVGPTDTAARQTNFLVSFEFYK